MSTLRSNCHSVAKTEAKRVLPGGQGLLVNGDVYQDFIVN